MTVESCDHPVENRRNAAADLVELDAFTIPDEPEYANEDLVEVA